MTFINWFGEIIQLIYLFVTNTINKYPSTLIK